MDIDVVLVEPLKAMLKKIATFAPVLLGALVIFVVGWLIARFIRLVVSKFLGLIHFDTIAEKGGVAKILTQGGIKATASQVLSRLVYWLIMIMVLVLTIDALGLEAVSGILDSIFAYLPCVIAAIFVLVIGMFIGVFVSGVIATAASGAHIPQAQLLSGISKYIIIIFAVLIALEQLKIKTSLIDNVVIILFGAIGLALAIAGGVAFGIGGKDLAAKYIEKLSSKKPPEGG